MSNTLPEDSPATAEMSYEEQQVLFKEILCRKPTCKFDETQPDFRTLLCPICLDVLKNPVDHSCGNSFCSNCVKTVSSCPVCRKESKQEDYKPASLFMKNCISSLKVECGMFGKSMTYEEFNDSHDKNCSFPCPFHCGVEVNRSTFEKHCKDGKCVNYLLSCPACEPPLCCKWHGRGGPEYDKHVSECVLIPFIPFATYVKINSHMIQNSISILQSSIEGLCSRQGHEFEDGERLENGIVPRKCKYCGHKYCCERDGHKYCFEKGENPKCKYCGIKLKEEAVELLKRKPELKTKIEISGSDWKG